VGPSSGSHAAVRLLPAWWSPAELSRWFDETAWWDTATFGRSPHRALVELLEAVAGRFTGREVALQMRGRAIRLRMNGVRIRTRDMPNAVEDPVRWWAETTGVGELFRWSLRAIGLDDARAAPPVETVALDATDVTIDGLSVGSVAAVVDGVRLDPAVPVPELVTGPIELDVRTTRASVVDWIRRVAPAWNIEPFPHGLLAVRVPRRHVRVLIRPTLLGRFVGIEPVGIIVFGLAVRLPRVLARTRVRPLPPLDASLEIVDTSVDGDEVTLRLRHHGIRQPLHLDAMRRAITDGTTKLTGAIFG
jgi:hypothetical protein